MGSIVGALQTKVENEDTRKEVYRIIIPEFGNADCDTLDECLGSDPAYDAVMKELNPEWFEND